MIERSLPDDAFLTTPFVREAGGDHQHDIGVSQQHQRHEFGLKLVLSDVNVTIQRNKVKNKLLRILVSVQ